MQLKRGFPLNFSTTMELIYVQHKNHVPDFREEHSSGFPKKSKQTKSDLTCADISLTPRTVRPPSGGSGSGLRAAAAAPVASSTSTEEEGWARRRRGEGSGDSGVTEEVEAVERCLEKLRSNSFIFSPPIYRGLVVPHLASLIFLLRLRLRRPPPPDMLASGYSSAAHGGGEKQPFPPFFHYKNFFSRCQTLRESESSFTNRNPFRRGTKQQRTVETGGRGGESVKRGSFLAAPLGKGRKIGGGIEGGATFQPSPSLSSPAPFYLYTTRRLVVPSFHVAYTVNSVGVKMANSYGKIT